MGNLNHADLHAAITYKKHPNIYAIRLGGLDELMIDVEDAQSRLLRSNLNEFMGSRVVSLLLHDGEKIRIARQLYGLAAVGVNGVKTFDIKTYGVHQGSLFQVAEDIEATTIDPIKSKQYIACIHLINAVVGGGNVVSWFENTNIDAIRFSETFSLNEESIKTGIIYKIDSPKNARVMSAYEIMAVREHLDHGKAVIPEGAVYLKTPLKGRELKLCGNPNDIEKYLGGLSKSEDFKLHKLDESYYAILPNIKL